LRKNKSCRLAYSIQPWAKDGAETSRGNAASTNGITRMVNLLQAGEIVPEKAVGGAEIWRPPAGANAAIMCTLKS
jgi:hypothetical protein